MSTIPKSSISEAAQATHAFVEVLKAENLGGWAERFASILELLRHGRAQEAIHLFSQTKYTGPGSLSDVYAQDEATFNSAWGNCGKALALLEQQANKQ